MLHSVAVVVVDTRSLPFHIGNYSAFCRFASFPSLQYTRWTARPMVWVRLWNCHRPHRGSSRPVRCRYNHPRRPPLPRSASPVIHRTLPGSVSYSWWRAAPATLVPWTRWGSSGRARLSAACRPRTPPAPRRALRSAITRGGRKLRRPPSLGWSLRPRLGRCSAAFSRTRTMAGTFGPRGSVRDRTRPALPGLGALWCLCFCGWRCCRRLSGLLVCASLGGSPMGTSRWVNAGVLAWLVSSDDAQTY